MRVSWRYLLAFPLGFFLALMLFVFFLYTQLGVPTNSSRWVYDLMKKQARLAAQVSGPRLLIVAGSSSLFGINAQLIQQQTGYPTINLGSHAGLTSDYILYRATTIARSGDIVLLALEYQFYEDQPFSDSSIEDDFVLAHDSAFFYKVPFFKKAFMATSIPFKRLQQGWKDYFKPERVPLPIPGPYLPISSGIDGLDENGDQMFNTDQLRPGLKPNELTAMAALSDQIPPERNRGLLLINKFIEWAKLQHIVVLATFPNVIDNSVYHAAQWKKAIDLITHFYQARGVPIIGTAAECMLPKDRFFDTRYHLTHNAALKRTARLIPELKPYLPQLK